jgi:hypothetical protein
LGRAAATTARWRSGWASRCGRTWRPRSTRWPPPQREAGLHLSINSAFRSDAEQARLFAANPNPKWVAPSGTSLHRYAAEFDLGSPDTYAWLAANARRFGFIHRYREAWHYGLSLAHKYGSAPSHNLGTFWMWGVSREDTACRAANYSNMR